MIARHRRKPADFDTVALARASDQYTGAEIEAVFIDALHEAYAEGREPLPRDLLDAMSNTVPIAQLMDARIAALRHWAKGRAREAGIRTNNAPRHGRRVGVVNGSENDNREPVAGASCPSRFPARLAADGPVRSMKFASENQ